MHTITVTAIVAARDKSPQVTMAIPHKDTAVQFTPDEARDLARSLMESAYVAEQESAIYAYIIRQGGTINDAARMLQVLREARKGGT
jgi:hypothetical protein